MEQKNPQHNALKWELQNFKTAEISSPNPTTFSTSAGQHLKKIPEKMLTECCWAPHRFNALNTPLSFLSVQNPSLGQMLKKPQTYKTASTLFHL